MVKSVFPKGFFDTQQNQSKEELQAVMNSYAFAYDSLDNVIVSPRGKSVDPLTITKMRAHFASLKHIARKTAPQKLNAIEQLEDISIRNAKGEISDAKAYQAMRRIGIHNGADHNLMGNIEGKVNATQRRLQSEENMGGLDLFRKKETAAKPIGLFVRNVYQDNGNNGTVKMKKLMKGADIKSPMAAYMKKAMGSGNKKQNNKNPMAAFFNNNKKNNNNNKNPMKSFFSGADLEIKPIFNLKQKRRK